MYREQTSKSGMTSDITSSSPTISLSTKVLVQQNRVFRGTGGVSERNRDEGFRPAFMDERTGAAYLSRFTDGRIAPLHVLDGLPGELVADRDLNGQVRAVKDCVVAGFLRGGLFYTRGQAARAVAH